MSEKEVLKKIQSGDDDFDKIETAEKEWINNRRKIMLDGWNEKKKEGETLEEKDLPKEMVGLALSGGGIRSATFKLGLLQALERYGVLKYVDYLSTVSGGGYIGSCFTWFMNRGKGFPFGTSRSDHDKLGGTVMAWLRSHGKYMTPGEGLNIWALASAVLTGILVNLLVMVPLFLLLFYGLSWDTGFIQFMPTFLHDFISTRGDPLLVYFFLIGAAFVLLWLALVILLTLLPGVVKRLRGSGAQRKIRIVTGGFLKYGIFLAAIGTIPLAYNFLTPRLGEWIQTGMSAISLTGLLAMAGGSVKREKGNEVKGGRSFLLSLGLALLVYGLFLWFYHLALHKIDVTYILAAAGFSLVLAFLTNINHASMHRFYRNRLMQAYMPERLEMSTGENIEIGGPDECYMEDIKDTPGPFHIVNTNIQTVGSDDYRLGGRGGDNFIFSPCFHGSDATGFVSAAEYSQKEKKMDLATAFAVSGAAVNPNTYATRSRPLSFIMSLLNARMGYWMNNPNPDVEKKHWLLKFFPMWYGYLFAEMFGKGLNERRKKIHLSDGGHFENLALYELIRRRCRYIIASDAGADKDWNYGDLAKVIEMARLDFGAKITIDGIDDLTPDKDTRLSKTPFVHGTIGYADGSTADLIYIKTTMVKDLPEDIHAYRRGHKDFPDQSTMDQFFSERQFEAYRELGFQVGRKLCETYYSENRLKLFFKLIKKGSRDELPVIDIDGVGKKYADLLEGANIHTLGDLAAVDDPLKPIGNIPPVKLREFWKKAMMVLQMEIDPVLFKPLGGFKISDILKKTPGELASEAGTVSAGRVEMLQEKLAGLQVALDDKKLQAISLDEFLQED